MITTTKWAAEYKGKSAAQWIGEARVVQMRAGNFEIVHDELPGAIFVADDDGDVCIFAQGQCVARLLCDSATMARLESLAEEVEAAYFESLGL